MNIDDDLRIIGEMAVELGLIYDVNNVSVIRSRCVDKEPSDWVLKIGETSAWWSATTLFEVTRMAKNSLSVKLKEKHKRKSPKGTYKVGRWELIGNIDEFKDYHLDIEEFADGEVSKEFYPKLPCMAYCYDYEGSMSGEKETIYLGIEEAKRLMDYVTSEEGKK